MGKLVVTEFITLDGVVEDPGGGEGGPYGGWAFKFDRGENGDRLKFDELLAADAQLLGRRTYEGFAQAWPKMNDNDFGRKFNSMPKHVVTSTLHELEWENSHIVDGDLADAVAGLKQRYDGDILVSGSAQLAQALLADGLVDRLHLMVFPYLAGGGKRLFADAMPPASFDLLETQQAGQTVFLVFGRKES
jgi:dihydrofolate reductase